MRYALKDLLIDSEARRVTRRGTVLPLPDLSFDLLLYLLEQAPKPVGIAEFAAFVWKTDYVSDETVAQRIALLRKALGDTSRDAIYIRTVRGVGYALGGSVEALSGEPQSPILSIATGFNHKALLGGALGVLFLVAAIWTLQQQTTGSPVDPSSSKTTATLMIEQARANLSLHQSTETDRAVRMLRGVLVNDPDNFQARLILSFALTTKATKFGGGLVEKKEAEEIARALIDEKPYSSNAWSALAYTLGAQGRPDESLSAYRRAYQLEPKNASALSSAAYEHLTRGNLYDALQLEMRAKSVGGSSRYAEIQIAQSLELIGHPATQDWQAKALSLNPNQLVVVSELARSLIRRGDAAMALRLLQRIEGDDRSAPQVLQLQGRLSLMLGNADAARKFFVQAGERAVLGLAALTAREGDTSLAEELLSPEKLIEFEADVWPRGRVNLAEVAAANGQHIDAFRLLTQAVNLGWRDTKWLQQSPYLGDLMNLPEGLILIERIERELEAQRLLIQADAGLKPFLQTQYAAVDQ